MPEPKFTVWLNATLGVLSNRLDPADRCLIARYAEDDVAIQKRLEEAEAEVAQLTAAMAGTRGMDEGWWGRAAARLLRRAQDAEVKVTQLELQLKRKGG